MQTHTGSVHAAFLSVSSYVLSCLGELHLLWLLFPFVSSSQDSLSAEGRGLTETSLQG